MPSKSPRQARLMAAAAHDPAVAAKLGLSQETAKEWHEADKARRDKLGKLSAVYGPRRQP
ncbi:MAG: hypothetical protein ABWZ01_07245 [Methyloceanibacter sp.]